MQFKTPMLWTLGFIVTFTIGGMSGVLLSIPAANYELHNTELLIAHFHNMLIPGALFGYFAGYAYWFPKVFGFKLNERWGRRAFWGWMIGFYLAFMPLYVLGMMGMPRRLDHYTNPAWQPYLEVALVGALFIAFGLYSQVMQVIVSIRERDMTRDLTGDPWNGRTLEWSMCSPPPFYNFARIPAVHSVDAFCYMKSKDIAYQAAERFYDIHMPKDTSLGFIIGVLAFLFGFAMIWHIWWLAGFSSLAIVTSIILRASEDHVEYVVPAETMQQRQETRLRQLATVSQHSGNDENTPVLHGTCSAA